MANGAIVYYSRHARRSSRTDKDYARALSNLAATALDRLKLHEQSQRKERRMAFLAVARSVLASSPYYESTLEKVGQLAVARIAD